VIAPEYLALANERMLRRVTVTCRSRKGRVPGLPKKRRRAPASAMFDGHTTTKNEPYVVRDSLQIRQPFQRGLESLVPVFTNRIRSQ
jgi:hypothetical protein